MGTESLQIRQPRRQIRAEWFQQLKAVLSGVFVPRGQSGAPTANAGGLGTTALQWLKAYIEIGWWKPGDVKEHHSYNSSLPPGHGWMLMDGRQITQANYDAEHGSGTWATYVGTSPLLNKYLPNLVDRYAIGVATTPYDGSSPIPNVAGSSNLRSFEHMHQWEDNAANSSANDKFYNAAGSPFDVSSPAANKTGGAVALSITNSGAGRFSANYFTEISQVALIDARPASERVVYYMRVI